MSNDNKIIVVVLYSAFLFTAGYITKSYNQEPIIEKVIGYDLTKIQPKRDTVKIPSEIFQDTKNFRPFVQDIVISCYKYPYRVKSNVHTFDGEGFRLWVSNGYKYFSLYEPQQIDFTDTEKQYLWTLYKNWQPNIRIAQ
jgi:hypothetical protein